MVITTDGFEISYPVSKLIHVDPSKAHSKKSVLMNEQEANEQKLKKKDKGPKFSKSHAEGKAAMEIEVDLHLEEILDNEKGMNNSQKLEYQLNYFRTELEAAISSNIKKIIFIHGVGNGRLKAEIRKELETYTNLSFSDASYKRYGFGATEVIIR